MHHPDSLATISDNELLRRLSDLMQQSRRVESDLVAHIGEADERRLYAREAFPSMYAYCTEVLHLSEAEAYLRITVARASRKHPILLAMLADGRLHLRGIVLLAPHLTPKNQDDLLKRATHKSKRQIEELVAELAPRPDAPSLMRKLPERRPASGPNLSARDQAGEPGLEGLELCPDRVPSLAPASALAPASTARASVQPLAPCRYRVQFTASAELQAKLRRLQALMRSKVPDGDLAALIEEAVTEKLERLEARHLARTKAPRKGLSETDPSPSSRHVPAAVRRVVWERDGGRCRFVDQKGRRCSEHQRLEFHHIYPFGYGGDHGPGGMRLMCRAHNQYLAEADYGREAMAGHRRSRQTHPG